MIHQIALYRMVPKMMEELRGFVQESAERGTAAEEREKSLRMRRAVGKGEKESREEVECRSLNQKYAHRIKRSQETLVALNNLQRCLNE